MEILETALDENGNKVVILPDIFKIYKENERRQGKGESQCSTGHP